ncbi:hypothetical protein [uncultured Psychrobacter sp.]|uniref:hypothetical protein n=1 Tax=uncultured Psychrobacter sp. TaxID=259303 RepID=UPI0030DB5A15
MNGLDPTLVIKLAITCFSLVSFIALFISIFFNKAIARKLSIRLKDSHPRYSKCNISDLDIMHKPIVVEMTLAALFFSIALMSKALSDNIGQNVLSPKISYLLIGLGVFILFILIPYHHIVARAKFEQQ